jgi:hypothetical protein
MYIIENVYNFTTPDPTFAFVGGPYCPTLDFVIAFWIMIAFYTLLTSLFCIQIGTPVFVKKLPSISMLQVAVTDYAHIQRTLTKHAYSNFQISWISS